ncbi:hypothetical protein NPIL_313841 [Nephila pilipes]|uniref:RNase H type-1 domain-containing protein n=1 Tax=Nephila pilipes TaxID=299642 RepID=A0A8X6P936_NEPPI|nr:hypothetical protein NPIL_313841 [Nephila pilipes]
MQMQTKIESPSHRRKIDALKLVENLKRRRDFWMTYSPAVHWLKSQPTFLQVTTGLSTIFDIPTKRQPLLVIKNFCRHLNLARCNLDFILPLSKKNYIETEFKMVTLVIIDERFPERHSLHVYTQGSATGAHTNLGVYSRQFSLSRAIDKHCTNFNGELDTVHMTLTEIAKRKEQNFVIFIDSQATIRVISSVMPSEK